MLGADNFYRALVAAPCKALKSRGRGAFPSCRERCAVAVITLTAGHSPSGEQTWFFFPSGTAWKWDKLSLRSQDFQGFFEALVAGAPQVGKKKSTLQTCKRSSLGKEKQSQKLGDAEPEGVGGAWI